MFGVFRTGIFKRTAPLPPKKSFAPQKAFGIAPKVSGKTESGEIDLGALFGAVRARRRWILGATALAFVGSVVFCNVVSQKYTAEARLLLENADSYYSRPDKDVGRTGTEAPIDPEAVLSQIQVMSSRDLTRAVVRKLKLGTMAEFDPVVGGVPVLTRLLVLFGLMRNPIEITPEERVIESFNQKVSIFQVGKSRVIAVEVAAHDPDIAAKIANGVADEYLLRQAEAKKQSTRIASEWLDQTIEPLRKKLAVAEGKVEAYRSKNNLFIGTNNNSLTSQQLSEMNTQVINAKALQADQQSRADLIRRALLTGRIFDVSDVIKDDLIRRLGESRATLKALLASESKVYLPQHPRIKELQAQIADLEVQIRMAAERTARSLDNDSKAGAARLAGLMAEIETQKKQATQANEDDVVLKALEREAKTLRDQLEAYSAKATEAKAHETPNSSPADARIVTMALAPSMPSFPKTVPIILIATIATLIVSTIVVIAGELLGTPARQAPEPRPQEPEGPNFSRSNADFADALGLYAKPAPRMETAANASKTSSKTSSSDSSSKKTSSSNLSSNMTTTAYRHPAMMAGASDAHGSGAPTAPERPIDMPTAEASGAPAPKSRALSKPEPASPPVLDQRRHVAELVDMLSERARRLASVQGGATIVLCRARRDIDASEVAIILGRRLARGGSVILAASNFKDRAIASLAEPGALGLSDVLDERATFAEAIHRDEPSRMHLLPFGFGARDVVTPELLESVVAALRRTYGYVLIDAGLVADTSEALLALAELGVLVSADSIDPIIVAEAIPKLDLAREMVIVQNNPAQPLTPSPAANDAKSGSDDSWTGMPAAR